MMPVVKETRDACLSKRKGEMERTKRKDCLYEGLVYPHGYEIREETVNRVCKDGEWESSRIGAEEAEPSLAYFYH